MLLHSFVYKTVVYLSFTSLKNIFFYFIVKLTLNSDFIELGYLINHQSWREFFGEIVKLNKKQNLRHFCQQCWHFQTISDYSIITYKLRASNTNGFQGWVVLVTIHYVITQHWLLIVNKHTCTCSKFVTESTTFESIIDLIGKSRTYKKLVGKTLTRNMLVKLSNSYIQDLQNTQQA